MFTSGEKIFNIFDAFFIIILLLSIINIIIFFILMEQVVFNFYYDNYYGKSESMPPISALQSIGFMEYQYGKNESKPRYIPEDSNLGFAGELILDCYIGSCEMESTETIKKCKLVKGEDEEEDEDEDEDENEECETYKYTYNKSIPLISCSNECFELKGEKCHKCPSNYNSQEGKCSRRTTDYYISGAYCTGDNIIYFWKGLKYQGFNYNYNYSKNVKLKNEECPSNTKNCGILDDNENKLCIPNNSSCPINTISEEKLNKTYSSFTVGNKTFYYGFDENDKNKKIIAGLYVDTDLHLNKKEKNYNILDTYTISGLLEENKILYKGVDLGFDPYKEKDIDQKGKSYLKIK